MKIPAPALWLILTACCGSVVGCAGAVAPDAAPLVVRQVYEPCERPGRPHYAPWRAGEHVGSRSNVEATMRNFAEALAYGEALEAALGCYERQAPDGDHAERRPATPAAPADNGQEDR